MQKLMNSVPRAWVRLLVAGRQPIAAGEWAIYDGAVRGVRACGAGLLVLTTTDADRLGSTVMVEAHTMIPTGGWTPHSLVTVQRARLVTTSPHLRHLRHYTYSTMTMTHHHCGLPTLLATTTTTTTLHLLPPTTTSTTTNTTTTTTMATRRHTLHYYYYILQEGGRHANECYDLPTQTSASPSREGSTASQPDRCHY